VTTQHSTASVRDIVEKYATFVLHTEHSIHITWHQHKRHFRGICMVIMLDTHAPITPIQHRIDTTRNSDIFRVYLFMSRTWVGGVSRRLVLGWLLPPHQCPDGHPRPHTACARSTPITHREGERRGQWGEGVREEGTNTFFEGCHSVPCHLPSIYVSINLPCLCMNLCIYMQLYHIAPCALYVCGGTCTGR
jgi:hypothetical protein